MFQFHEAAQQKQEHTLESNFQQLRHKIDACLELKAIGKVKRSRRKDEDEKTPCK
jgi:hypothetical protein